MMRPQNKVDHASPSEFELCHGGGGDGGGGGSGVGGGGGGGARARARALARALARRRKARAPWRQYLGLNTFCLNLCALQLL